jgi:hypothetical protein
MEKLIVNKWYSVEPLVPETAEGWNLEIWTPPNYDLIEVDGLNFKPKYSTSITFGIKATQIDTNEVRTKMFEFQCIYEYTGAYLGGGIFKSYGDGKLLVHGEQPKIYVLGELPVEAKLKIEKRDLVDFKTVIINQTPQNLDLDSELLSYDGYATALITIAEVKDKNGIIQPFIWTDSISSIDTAQSKIDVVLYPEIEMNFKFNLKQ